MSDARTIALVGGSGLGPWVWGRVSPILEARGFRVLTPELRSTGEDSTPALDIDLGDWIDDLVLALEGEEEVTLVAHSFAGYVAAGVIARRTGHLRSVVFLDAVLPRPGRSWFDVMGPGVRDFMTGLARDGAVPWFTREQLDQLYPEHGISAADFAWMQSRVAPQPLATYAQPAITESLSSTETKLAYVRCLRTTPPASDVSEDNGWTFTTLDTGHWPMVTDSVATARIIEDLARRQPA